MKSKLDKIDTVADICNYINGLYEEKDKVCAEIEIEIYKAKEKLKGMTK